MTRRRPAPQSVDSRGEFPFDPSTYLLHLMYVVTRNRDARLEQITKAFDCDLAGARAMIVIDRLGSCTMGEVADYSVIDRTTLTRIVDSLVEAGFVERRKVTEDRRQVVLELTALGRRQHRRMTARSIVDNTSLTDGLPEDEVRAAARLLKQIASRLVLDPNLLERFLWTRSTEG
jgi:MarR family transcriptional regulator, organic hydroperoxide resistance regulator